MHFDLQHAMDEGHAEPFDRGLTRWSIGIAAAWFAVLVLLNLISLFE